MAIHKKPYELSIWKEELIAEGRKQETKLYIIGAHDMTYLGRATAIKFARNLNGTYSLTFQMPDRFFDSEKGDFVKNEFIDELFTERKVKLYYKDKWYEFYIKKVSEAKNYKTFLKTYECSSAFIDELSRNGYGITFDTELYNNVEEIGVFSGEILEDSIWEYHPEHNWGDFTEYLEEKLFRIPIECFGGKVNGYKLNFTIDDNEENKLTNIYTGETRAAEMGDDLARVKGYYWDKQDNSSLNLKKDLVNNIINDGYIYVPYSCLDFCYTNSNPNSEDIDYAATETPCNYPNKKSFALAPPTVDPNYLIQFIALPRGAKVEVDEAGLILSKDYTYFMTLNQWNEQINGSSWYIFEDTRFVQSEVAGFEGTSISYTYKYLANEDDLDDCEKSLGNKCVYYEGYLSEYDSKEIVKGKKISITDRTEINISEEIDQYVTVYNNKYEDFKNFAFSNDEWDIANDKNRNTYRICSKIDTRQIIPQLARNLLQNGTVIKSTNGWEVMDFVDNTEIYSANLSLKYSENSDNSNDSGSSNKTYLYFTPCRKAIKKVNEDKTEVINYKYANSNNEIIFDATKIEISDENNSFINFGIVGQEKKIEKNKVYCLGFTMAAEDNVKIKIGEGSLISSESYALSDNDTIELNVFGNNPWAPPEGINWEELDSNKERIPDSVTLNTHFILFKTNKEIKNPYLVINSNHKILLEQAYLFEAYTKGSDQFENENLYYKYSGRELFGNEQPKGNNASWTKKDNFSYSAIFSKEEIQQRILFEDDIMQGDTYSYQKYFIQRLVVDGVGYDTTGAKAFTSTKDLVAGKLPLDAAKYSPDDYKIQTNYIDLNSCPHYIPNAKANQCDCKYGVNDGKSTKTCIYQKFGYCPYLFTTEKHCRKVRTLNGQKSNRFNLTQEIGKVFNCYPVYYTNHNENGTIKYKDNKMDKEVFYITEKGKENKIGFRYEKNLSNISRTIESNQIVTKLYVEDVDSELSKTGLCSIKLAEDNPSKDNFIIDFSYYLAKGILNKEEVEKDLYGIENTTGGLPQGYLKQLGYYNTQYDLLENKIINLQDASYNELEANLTVNLEGIETSQKQLRKYQQEMEKYKKLGEDNPTYLNYQVKYAEQYSILKQLIIDTFSSNGYFMPYNSGVYKDIWNSSTFEEDYSTNNIIYWIDNIKFENVKEDWLNTHIYEAGILGQFNKEYKQIQTWKKEQANLLKEINNLSLSFYQKYEPYLKEGTWSDSNYLIDNAYYQGALEVAAEGAIPKVNYSISVVDLSSHPDYADDFNFDLADTTYVEDIGLFGINKKTGLPNRLKVLISKTTEDLDIPKNNTFEVQNFTTQFEDLFQQVTAAVQSLTYNENIYKRSSNFTSMQNIEQDSLQGTLNTNQLTLLKTDENNISLDSTGQSGSDINNHSNKYRINGQGILFSNDGAQSWNAGIGPDGMNMDYASIGTLDVSKVKIADKNYLYFLWDKNGVVSYRDPAGINTNSSNLNDFAMFNKFGLSLAEQGNIRLRAGYSFNGSNNSINSEQNPGENIGFYLYNTGGNMIFATEAPSGDSGADEETARILLAGEMFVTDDINELGESLEPVSQYKYTTGLVLDKKLVYSFERITDELGDDKQISSLNNEDSYSGYIANNKEKIYTDFYQIIVNNNEYYYYRKSENPGEITSLKGKTLYRLIETDNILVFKSEDKNATITVPSSSENQEYYNWSNNENCYLRAPTLAHYVLSSEFSYWKTQEEIAQNTQPADENDTYSIGMYLNNRNSLDSTKGDSITGFNKRIFSIIKKYPNSEQFKFKNIFSVLRDGSLYIGGTVQEPPDVDQNESTLKNLNANIKINNSYIKLTANGYLQMDFAKLQNKNGQNLLSVISNTVGNAINSVPPHRHRLNTLYFNKNFLSTILTPLIVGGIQNFAPLINNTNFKYITEDNLLQVVQILCYYLNNQFGNRYILNNTYTNREENL